MSDVHLACQHGYEAKASTEGSEVTFSANPALTMPFVLSSVHYCRSKVVSAGVQVKGTEGKGRRAWLDVVRARAATSGDVDASVSLSCARRDRAG